MLTKAAVAALFETTPDAVDGLVAGGRLPRPWNFGCGDQRWHQSGIMECLSVYQARCDVDPSRRLPAATDEAIQEPILAVREGEPGGDQLQADAGEEWGFSQAADSEVSDN